MKQTAVDYLFSKLWDTERDKFEWHSILIKAKEMEKKQIIKNHIDGFDYVVCESRKNFFAEKYYQENYGDK
jgi:hypothetical protein